MLPRKLSGEWSKAIGDVPEPDRRLYGEVCSGEGLMHLISFDGSTVVRIGEEPGDLFWLPDERGGLVVQWIGADSLEDLLMFAQKVAAAGDWQEALEITISDPELRMMDSCGFDGDEQPKIDVSIVPGDYEIRAAYAEDENTMATVFSLNKKE